MDKRALIEKFHQMDQNGDGILSLSEIRKCVLNSGLPATAVQEFLELFDLSGDNVITLQEYVTALGLDPPPPKDVKSWRTAFDEFDKDHSGKLTISEVCLVLKELGYKRIQPADVDQWMRMVDKNGDNMIDFSEFAAFLHENWKTN